MKNSTFSKDLMIYNSLVNFFKTRDINDPYKTYDFGPAFDWRFRDRKDPKGWVLLRYLKKAKDLGLLEKLYEPGEATKSTIWYATEDMKILMRQYASVLPTRRKSEVRMGHA